MEEVVLGNFPQNAAYTSPKTQKKILFLFAIKVQSVIIKELGQLGQEKFCNIVDEAEDESKKE